MYRNILLPTDGSEQAAQAIAAGVALAARLGAEVTGLHVELETGVAAGIDKAMHEGHGETHAAAEAYLRIIADEAERQHVTHHCFRVGAENAADAIIEAAQARKCDLIVMASHGHTGLARLMMGSVTRQVLDRCAIPTLVYR